MPEQANGTSLQRLEKLREELLRDIENIEKRIGQMEEGTIPLTNQILKYSEAQLNLQRKVA